MGYEILEHTGDVKIRVFGNTKQELFESGAKGMFHILQPEASEKSSVIRTVSLQAQDINALLVDFLSEINYLRQVNREAYETINFLKFSDIALEAELQGREAQSFTEDIKAVTFHGLHIQQNPQGVWETNIVFDV